MIQLGLGLSLTGRGQGSWGAGATMALDFTRKSFSNSTQTVSDPSLLTGWTFTRASAKTALDSQGNVISFASGVPAITDLGFLIEQSATNFLLNSNAPATQTTGSLGTGTYTLWVVGSGAAAVTAGTGTATGLGTASAGSVVTFTVTVAGTFTVTVTGSLSFFQLENVAFATSRIITAGATAARAADVASIGGLVAPANWTLLAIGSRMTSAGFSATASLNDGTTTNEAYLISNDPGFSGVQAQADIKIGGVGAGGAIGSSVVGAVAKMAMSAAGTAVAASVNGGAPVNFTMAGALPYTTLNIGTRAAGGTPLNGLVQRVGLYSSALNTQTLTQ